VCVSRRVPLNEGRLDPLLCDSVSPEQSLQLTAKAEGERVQAAFDIAVLAELRTLLLLPTPKLHFRRRWLFATVEVEPVSLWLVERVEKGFASTNWWE